MNKNEFYFNKGAEFWYANYYENLGLHCKDVETVSEFGKYFSDVLNNDSRKEKLSQFIRETVKDNFGKFNDFNEEYFDSMHFSEDEKIKYKNEYRYIRFPDFTTNRNKGLLLRLDINPCIGTEDTMTKVYCNIQYRNNISGDDTLSFFKRSRPVSMAVVKFLTNLYLDSHMSFAGCKGLLIENVNKSSLQNPFIVDSLMVGSSDEMMRFYLSQMENKSMWQEYCKKDTSGKRLNNLLVQLNKDINSRFNRRWKLSDYDWIKQKVTFKQKDDLAKKPVTHNSVGYVGYTGDGSSLHLLGVSDSYPSDILLPLHLELIRSTAKPKAT